MKLPPSNIAVATDAGLSPARLASRSARRPAPLNRRGVGRRKEDSARLVSELAMTRVEQLEQEIAKLTP
ncbi:MAG TPA: hypothetical protein VF701_20475, partial [Thermoanaerobaculia bacterium]